jgi:hypothetical protein
MLKMPDQDDRLTVAAIAGLAFMVSDVAHEVIGHGLGFFLAGGHTGIYTTTRVIETQRLGDRGGDVFDMGGPFGNLLCAALAWLALRFVPTNASRLRLFCSLTLAFSLFWAFGYLAFCGVKGQGDWFALIRAASHQWVWRSLLFMAGVLFYLGSMKLVASQFGWTRRALVISYLAGGLMGVLGAILDPRGFPAIRHDGLLSGFGSALGMLAISATGNISTTISRNFAWIVAAGCCAGIYIFVLGPGLKFTF